MGYRVGALDSEAARCPECRWIVHQGCGSGNLVFTLIWYQVFALVRTIGNPR